MGFLLAGASKLPWRRFILYDIAGATIWGVGHTVLGFFIGATFETWEPYLTRFGLVLGALLIGYVILHRRRQKRREAELLAAAEGDGDGAPGI